MYVCFNETKVYISAICGYLFSLLSPQHEVHRFRNGKFKAGLKFNYDT